MTKLVEAPKLDIKKTTEFKPGAVASKLPEGISTIKSLGETTKSVKARQPFGMRPQEVIAPSEPVSETVYDPKKQGTNFDLRRPFKAEDGTSWSLTNGKVDDL